MKYQYYDERKIDINLIKTFQAGNKIYYSSHNSSHNSSQEYDSLYWIIFFASSSLIKKFKDNEFIQKMYNEHKIDGDQQIKIKNGYHNNKIIVSIMTVIYGAQELVDSSNQTGLLGSSSWRDVEISFL